MKIRYFIIATLAMVLLAVSCQKTAIGGPEESEEAPVPIQLTTNLKVNSVSVTKAGVDAWNEQKLYIYAFPTNEIPAANSTDILVNNAMAFAPTDGGTGEDRYIPKDISLYKTNVPQSFYYYPADKTTLDFYGYYVGDAAGDTPAPTITANTSVVLPIILDGSQDIMLAKADKIADTDGKEIAPANAYSAYSARKHVKPNLKFEHLLSRFVFNVVAGNDEGRYVKITGVTLSSKKQADLVIASKGAVPLGINSASNEGTFQLKNVDGTDLSSFFPENTVNGGEPYQFVTADKVGESIMVIPGTTHKMVMTMQQMSDKGDDATELGEPFTYEYDLVPGMIGNPVETQGEEFLPGYQYNVNVVVYGREEVKVSVQLAEWTGGGSIIIDNDKEWGDEPKLGYKATKGETDYYLYFYANPIVEKTDDVPGTEVRVWDPASNTMVSAEPGTYKFTTAVQGCLYVTLAQEGEGENLKTVVTALSATDPAETPGTE